MSRSEREKGRKGEAEVAAIYRAAGLTVRGLEATGDHLVVAGPDVWPTLHSEAKRQETARPWLWWEQASSEAPAGTVPVVAFRRNRSTWLALLELEQLAQIVGRLTGATAPSDHVGKVGSCPRCCIEWVDVAIPHRCTNCGAATVPITLAVARARAGMPPC